MSEQGFYHYTKRTIDIGELSTTLEHITINRYVQSYPDLFRVIPVYIHKYYLIDNGMVHNYKGYRLDLRKFKLFCLYHRMCYATRNLCRYAYRPLTSVPREWNVVLGRFLNRFHRILGANCCPQFLCLVIPCIS